MLAPVIALYRRPTVTDWPGLPGRLPSIHQCVLLAVLLHLLAVLMFGSVPGGSAQPGQGIWGSLNVRLAGDGPPQSRAETPAPEAYTGPKGEAAERRFGGAVRREAEQTRATAEPGAAQLGTWNPTPTARPADPLPPAASPQPEPPPAPVPEPIPPPVLRELSPPREMRELQDVAPLPASPAALPAPSLAPAPAPELAPPPRAPVEKQLSAPAPTPLPVERALPRSTPLEPLNLPAAAAPLPPLPELRPAPVARPPPEPRPAPTPLPEPRLAPPAPSVPPTPTPTAPTPTPPLPTPQPQALPDLQPTTPPPAAPTAPAPTPTPAAAAPRAETPTTPVTPATPAAPAAPATPAPRAERSPQPGAAQPPAGTTNLEPIARPGFGAPDAGATVGHDVATPATAPASAPRLNLDLPRQRGGELSRQGSRGVLPLLPRPPERKDKLAEDIEKSAKPDCRTAYGGLGLLAVVPLAVDAVKQDGGCRW